MDLETKIFWATKFRNFGLGLTVLTAVVSGLSTYLQSRWQSQSASLKAAEAKKREDVLHGQVSEGQEQTKQLQIALEKERRARQPRKFSAAQSSTIANNLRVLVKKPGIPIYVVSNRFDYEAVDYSKKIVEVLRAGGLNPLTEGGPLGQILTVTAPDVQLWMHDVNKPPADVEKIQAAFWAAGFYFPGSSTPQYQDGILIIAVGTKSAEPPSLPFPFSKPE